MSWFHRWHLCDNCFLTYVFGCNHRSGDKLARQDSKTFENGLYYTLRFLWRSPSGIVAISWNVPQGILFISSTLFSWNNRENTHDFRKNSSWLSFHHINSPAHTSLTWKQVTEGTKDLLKGCVWEVFLSCLRIADGTLYNILEKVDILCRRPTAIIFFTPVMNIKWSLN